MAKKLGVSWVGCALLLASCAGETLSVGELRCERTNCEAPSVDDEIRFAQAELEEIDAGEARLVWTAEPPPCGDDECQYVAEHGVDTAQWLVHGDGSVTTARAFIYVPEEEPRTVRTGISLARFDAGGELLAENHDLTETDEMSSGSIRGTPWIALAGDGDDGAQLALGRRTDDPPALTIYAVAPSGEPRRVVELAAGGTPAAMVVSGEDLLIAGTYGDNVELGRYHRDAELQWRQTALVPPDRELRPLTGLGSGTAGIQLAADAAGNGSLLLPGGPGYGLVQVDAAGEVSRFMWLTWSNGRMTLKGQIAYDSEDRLVIALDAYAVMRCAAGGCGADGAEPLVAVREREEYYDPEVLGLAIDAQDRIYVLTQDGVRSRHRLLIDRISADFTRRETFTVAGGEQLMTSEGSQTPAHEIRIGPEGSVYVWTPERLGRIDLP